MRVIAGTAKGTRLTAPRQGARPTTDRVREAVFSSLVDWAGRTCAAPATQLAGLSVLDLFAGSGAVAIEAASRGASAVAVDSSASAVSAIQANVHRAGVEVQVTRATVEHYLRGAPPDDGFDIVWLDPPYEADVGILNHLGGWVAADGLVAIERSTRTQEPDWPPRFARRWSKRYGETMVYFAEAQEGVT